MPPITFTDEDFQDIDLEQDDLMVITVEIAKYVVYEDSGGSRKLC